MAWRQSFQWEDLQREHKRENTEEANSKLLQGEAWQQAKRRQERTAARWFVESGGMTQKKVNTEKILGTGRQEIVSDLIKSCFKEKMEQKLEMIGQKKKKRTGKRHKFQEEGGQCSAY